MRLFEFRGSWLEENLARKPHGLRASFVLLRFAES
jgi:hypothetical protein